MIGFIVALSSEAEAILNHSTIISQSTVLTNKSLYRIKIGEVPAVILVCGAGKVYSALATQYIIDHYSVDYIVNIGTCGGVVGEAQLGQVYLIDKCVLYDFDLSEIDTCSPGVVPYFTTAYIPINNPIEQQFTLFNKSSLATGDRFTQSDDVALYIKNNFGCSLRDMEGASIAIVCHVNSTPLIMLKGVSDYVGSQSVNMYLKYSSSALDSIGDKVVQLAILINKYCEGIN
ncbi:MAG: 5'-methylthioadenosine/S-adenosylhomocysteine nucleosidase [Clostridia bacterium]|nr:5'-methylthioadenosine/S-adenosylhomocysteine nucleosidase [Clostridia bacterium]